MGFLGVYKAVYDYVPQGEGELQIEEGDVLYILDKGEDDGWWNAKKKAAGDDDDEPEGLVPNNYVEEAQSIGSATALYEYTRQTDEELSFPEDAALEVFDTSDPDWILVGLDGDFGFVPSNYIELHEEADVAAQPTPPTPPTPPTAPSLPARPALEPQDELESPDQSSPIAAPVAAPVAASVNQAAAALANVLHGRAAASGPTPPISPRSAESEPSENEDEGRTPALPARPRAEEPPPEPRATREQRPVESIAAPRAESPPYRTPGGFHMYNINEMVSVMGKRKKMPTTLGINLGTGTILIAPERSQDGPSQEWAADKMTHYSREGKHVFLEMVRPSKSVDFHAGAKDTAEEIVAALAELAGPARAEGLREVMLAGANKSQKKGQVLYDFTAQGDDEVTVVVGDEVIILDDTTSDEWWQVQRLKNGKEGVVPSSYIEITGVFTPPPASTGLNAGRSTVEQNRLEEIRLTKEAIKAAQRETTQQVGPGMPLPERGSSLLSRENGSNSGQQRSKRENGRSESSGQGRSKTKPDPSKVRTWTDRTKSFSVEAQFLTLKEGKIHLHKMNGVKIAVPVAKMSVEDLDYVERITGVSLDNNRPLSDSRSKGAGVSKGASARAGATVEQARKPEYDWFQFFLSCDIAVGLCERYAQAFAKDSMDESVLSDVDAGVLRTLGLREGDIIKVMRALDAKFGRTNKRNVSFAGDQGDGDGENGAAGGLFSGPGGALRNNTRKGRPAPAVATNDVVDAKAFSHKDEAGGDETGAKATPSAGDAPRRSGGGFDDDAWDVKPAKQQSAPASKAVEAPAAPAPGPQPQAPSGSMQELSLLTAPLHPSKVEPAKSPETTSPVTAQQPPGATPSFFAAVAQQSSAGPNGQPNQQMGRQRPLAPEVTGGTGALMPPPPTRPLSAPQTAQPSAFTPPPILPQMTGVPLQTQVAAPGQSLGEINQARLQQQYAQQMQTGMGAFPMQPPSQGLQAFPTGVQFMQPMMTGAPAQSPFADPRPTQFLPMQPQATGVPGSFAPGQSFGQPPPGGVNSYLAPPLEPQRTGMPSFQPQAAPGPGFNQAAGSAPAPAPGPAPQPLQPQQTGPPPPVRFGVSAEAPRLAPQPTGRRANLSQATPQNPFGF